MRYLSRIFSVGLCLIGLTSPSFAEEAKTGLTLGIHPYLTAQELTKRFSPLAEYLSAKLGVPVTVQIAKDYNVHIDDAGQDKLDIAYMGPPLYVEMVKKYGTKPILARQEDNGTPLVRSSIVTSPGSGINSLQDLVGKRFAYASRQATMLPRYTLLEAGITDDKLAKFDYLGSHDDVVLAVLTGDYDAGAVKEEMIAKYASRGLKLLALTVGISSHLFTTSSKLPAAQIETLRQALLNLKQEPDGMRILTSIQPTVTGFVPGSDTDYDDVRAILDTLKAKGITP